VKYKAVNSIKIYEDFATRFNIDLKDEVFYKSLIQNIALDNFNKGKYLKAYNYFNKYFRLDKDNPYVIDFVKQSRYNYLNWLNKIIGFSASILLLVKYTLRLGFKIDGFGITILTILAMIVLIVFLAIELFNKKPKPQSV
jgi:hypothetical protein